MGKIVIEVLFPEVANLYGDRFNVNYLAKSLSINGCEVEIIEDELSKEPYFVNNKPDFVYMGPMTEHSQELVIDKLMPYKARIETLIEERVVFLITGNAVEIFVERIECEDGKVIDAMSLFPLVAKRKMFRRYNSLFLGTYEDIKVVGFKSQFSHSYNSNAENGFLTVVRGDGMSPGENKEGVIRNNFMGTYLLGPLLVLNPDFTKLIMKRLGVIEPKLCYEKEANAAYELRLREFEDMKTELN